MADTAKAPKKDQLTLEQYMKVKEKLAKSKLKLHVPLLVKVIIGLPMAYILFLMVYFVLYLRFVAEH